MKLPSKIKTTEEARIFIKMIFNWDVLLHPDDDAHDIVTPKGEKFFTDKQADKINELYGQVFELEDFCPYAYNVMLLNNEFNYRKNER